MNVECDSSDYEEDGSHWGHVTWIIFSGLFAVLPSIGMLAIYNERGDNNKILFVIALVPAVSVLLRMFYPLPTIGRGLALVFGCILWSIYGGMWIFLGTYNKKIIIAMCISIVFIISGYRKIEQKATHSKLNPKKRQKYISNISERYSQMSEEEFSKLNRDDLTEDAKKCYDQEFENRSSKK